MMEDKVLETSKRFWAVMEAADGAGMRAIADPGCRFVHIGITCGLEKEIGFYTSGAFKPTRIVFNSQNAALYGEDTAVVITDCVYALLLDGKETSHHFAVTEVYTRAGEDWKLVQFSFTALVY